MSRPIYYNNEYRNWLRQKITSLPGEVFLRRDLSVTYSNGEQLRINRALKAFITEGLIIKLGHGLYAKAHTLTLADNKQVTVLRNSFERVAIEALDKLGLKWEFGTAIQEYNRGETTQVPMTFTIKLKSRYRGTISAEGRTVHFEGDTNAR